MPKRMKYLIATAMLAVASLVVYWAFFAGAAPAANRYENRTLGIAFSYPEGFAISEGEFGTLTDGHYAITLVRETDTALPEAGEGPTSVTVEVRERGDATLHEWMRQAPASNFHLGPGSYASTTVGGADAVIFAWSGLYEGETTAFLHGERIVSISGTVLSEDDGMREAYELVRDSFELR